MSYEAYKVLHILGVLVVFASLGGLAALRAMRVLGKPGAPRLFNILHGLGLAIVLIAGFGLLTRIGIPAPGAWPAWVWIKLTVWLLLGAGLVVLKRAEKQAGGVLALLVLLGALSAWSAIFKP